MQDQDETGPHAHVFALDGDVRRDAQIFLRRSCAYRVTASRLALPTGPEAFTRPPDLLVVSGLEGSEAAIGLVLALRDAGQRGFLLYLASADGIDEAGDAFAAGADDVLRAPFTIREFGLRLRARLGVSPARILGSEIVPQVLLDQNNTLHAMGTRESVRLTRAEAELMAVLIRSGGRIVSREDLARQIDQASWEYGDRRFDVHVANIRKKLRKAFGTRYALRAIRFKGYAFCEEAGADSA